MESFYLQNFSPQEIEIKVKFSINMAFFIINKDYFHHLAVNNYFSTLTNNIFALQSTCVNRSAWYLSKWPEGHGPYPPSVTAVLAVTYAYFNL